LNKKYRYLGIIFFSGDHSFLCLAAGPSLWQTRVAAEPGCDQGRKIIWEEETANSDQQIGKEKNYQGKRLLIEGILVIN
jgi:hypothetical protein